jgi:hypothetical protein
MGGGTGIMLQQDGGCGLPIGVGLIQGVEQAINNGVNNGASSGKGKTGMEPQGKVSSITREGVKVMCEGKWGRVQVQELR